MAKPGRQVDRLVDIYAKLRAPGGCPWDRDRTLADLGKYLREECDEVVAEIRRLSRARGAGRRRAAAALREECGDLLGNLVFTIGIARERGWFDFEEVARGACEKITRRHPHVFGGAKAETSEEVEVLWQDIKARENAGRRKSGAKRKPEARRKPGRRRLPAPARSGARSASRRRSPRR